MSTPAHRPESTPWQPPEFDERFREDRLACPPELPFEIEDLLLIVVGAHIKSEIADRPLGQRLQRVIRDWQAAVLEEGDQVLLPVLVSDVWFLNDRDLMQQPCITIGEPGLNAATAYYATRLPKSYVVENVCAIQFDPQFLDGSVCIWGKDAASTELAVETFIARHLEAYLKAVHFV
jgi:hypothetical protein